MSERKRTSLTLSDVFLTIGLLLLAAALFWALFNIREDRMAGAASEETLIELLKRAEAQAMADAAAADEEEEQYVGEIDKPMYELNPDLEMPKVEINGRNYIGFLYIPSLELELPVAADLSNEMLKIAPCYYTGSVYKDNLVIAAHNYRRHFGRIGTMNEGDVVEFTDGDGHVFHFRAVKVEILGPYEVQRMTESDYPLTLFTCTLGGANRVTLRCERAYEDTLPGLLPAEQ